MNSRQRQRVQHVTWSIDHSHQRWMIKLHTRYGLVRHPLLNISKCLVVIFMYMFSKQEFLPRKEELEKIEFYLDDAKYESTEEDEAEEEEPHAPVLRRSLRER
jgi:hypothetical protein